MADNNHKPKVNPNRRKIFKDFKPPPTDEGKKTAPLKKNKTEHEVAGISIKHAELPSGADIEGSVKVQNADRQAVNKLASAGAIAAAVLAPHIAGPAALAVGIAKAGLAGISASNTDEINKTTKVADDVGKIKKAHAEKKPWLDPPKSDKEYGREKQGKADRQPNKGLATFTAGVAIIAVGEYLKGVGLNPDLAREVRNAVTAGVNTAKGVSQEQDTDQKSEKAVMGAVSGFVTGSLGDAHAHLAKNPIADHVVDGVGSALKYAATGQKGTHDTLKVAADATKDVAGKFVKHANLKVDGSLHHKEAKGLVDKAFGELGIKAQGAAGQAVSDAPKHFRKVSQEIEKLTKRAAQDAEREADGTLGKAEKSDVKQLMGNLKIKKGKSTSKQQEKPAQRRKIFAHREVKGSQNDQGVSQEELLNDSNKFNAQYRSDPQALQQLAEQDPTRVSAMLSANSIPAAEFGKQINASEDLQTKLNQQSSKDADQKKIADPQIQESKQSQTDISKQNLSNLSELEKLAQDLPDIRKQNLTNLRDLEKLGQDLPDIRKQNLPNLRELEKLGQDLPDISKQNLPNLSGREGQKNTTSQGREKEGKVALAASSYQPKVKQALSQEIKKSDGGVKHTASYSKEIQNSSQQGR